MTEPNGLGQSGDRDEMLMVSRGQLERGAEWIEKHAASSSTGTGKLANGVDVSAPQLRAAAAILRDGAKTVITSATGVGAGDPPVTLGEEHDLPCFIHADRQEDPGVLRIDVGILTGGSYLIDRAGTVTEAGR